MLWGRIKMGDREYSTKKFSDLRRRAQAYMSAPREEAPHLSQEAVKKLVHELDTYQVELELQNEDLRRTQQDLETSQRRISDLYDFAPVGYLTIGSSGNIDESNLTAADMLGMERKFLIGHPLFDFIAPEDQDTCLQAQRELCDGGRTQTYGAGMIKKGGKRFTAQFKSSINPDLDGNSGQYRTAISDITEQKKLEDAILQSKIAWESTFDAMNDIVTLMDKDFYITRANRKAYDFFNAEPEELTGKHCYELFRDNSIPCPEGLIADGADISHSHFSKVVDHNNLEKTFEVSFDPVFNDSGELQHLVHVARDVTKVKRLEEELLQSHKMQAMGTLAGGIAHDFNNILGAMLGYSELIRDDPQDPVLVRKYINQVIAAENRAAGLINQILTFSKKGQITSGEPLRPQIIVKEILKMLRASFPVTLELREIIDPYCDAVQLDPTSLHQILMNLCNNAFQASENERCVITVQLSNIILSASDIGVESDVTPGPFVELLVNDTCGGMEKSVIDHIFEPYYTTKRFGTGSGIGLAVVFGIVKSHKGMIKVESEVGRGSTFKIYFPSSGEGVQEKEGITEEQILPTGTEHILIVDDEEMIVDYMKACLERLGYTVAAHTKSLEALEDFNSHPDKFDLVITDQTMAKLTGVELSKKMWETRQDIPIILCTGYSSMISKKKAEKMGIKHFALKPINNKDLAQIIREVLDSKD
jgi:two-component system cell cycle sensor histidine kinase/response regulator CckA